MKRVIIATDGGRQHFKLFQNMHFMSEQHILRGLKLWWLFFQSYHGEAVTSPTVCCRFAMSCKEQCSVMRIRPIAGKGPADGGGNWLKSALALACLAGVSISNVYEVFMYALRNLVNNKTTSNFNEGRYYYYVTLYELAEYRSRMPAEVKGSLNIQPGKTDGTGWFFGPALTQQASWYNGEQPARAMPVMTMHLIVAVKKTTTSSKMRGSMSQE